MLYYSSKDSKKFNVFNGLKGIQFALILLVLSTFILSNTAKSAEGPALWKIENRQSTLYIFGTFHLLTPDVKWLDDRIIRAVEASDELILEIDETQMSRNILGYLIRDKGMLPRNDDLINYLSDENWKKFEKLSISAGLPVQNMRRFKPWYAATILTVQYAQAHGFDPEIGVEKVFTKMMRAARKPLTGLERAADQISALADQPDNIQMLMLEDTVVQLENLPEIYKDIIAAWLSGDEMEMEKALLEDMTAVPELYDALIIKRNRNWIPKIQQILSEPGVHFLAVGSAHLVGEDSILNMLRVKGHVAERVED